LGTRIEDVRHRRTPIGELQFCCVLSGLRRLEGFASSLKPLLQGNEFVVSAGHREGNVLVALDEVCSCGKLLRRRRVSFSLAFSEIEQKIVESHFRLHKRNLNHGVSLGNKRDGKRINRTRISGGGDSRKHGKIFALRDSERLRFLFSPLPGNSSSWI